MTERWAYELEDERKKNHNLQVELSALKLQINEWRDRVNQLQEYIVNAGLPIPQPNYVLKRNNVHDPACGCEGCVDA